MDDFKYNPANIRIQKSCTSTLQAWGQGKKRKKNPGPVHDKNYNNKINSKLIHIDPRPLEFRDKKIKKNL